MKRLTILFMSFSLILSQGLFVNAQQTQAPPMKEIIIPDGTEFSVVATETISSKTASEGDPVNFRVDEDVVINGMVVITEGTLVKGYVANAEKKGHMGKAGKLDIRIESTRTVDNQHIKLRASHGKEGESKTGTTVALTVLFGPLGLLKHGKDAEIKAGTRIRVFTDEEKIVHTNIAEVVIPKSSQQVQIHPQAELKPSNPPETQTEGNPGYQLNGINAR